MRPDIARRLSHGTKMTDGQEACAAYFHAQPSLAALCQCTLHARKRSLTLHYTPLSAGAAGKLASVPHERPVSSRRTLVRVSGGHLSNPRPDSGAPDNSRYRIPV